MPNPDLAPLIERLERLGEDLRDRTAAPPPGLEGLHRRVRVNHVRRWAMTAIAAVTVLSCAAAVVLRVQDSGGQVLRVGPAALNHPGYLPGGPHSAVDGVVIVGSGTASGYPWAVTVEGPPSATSTKLVVGGQPMSWGCCANDLIVPRAGDLPLMTLIDTQHGDHVFVYGIVPTGTKAVQITTSTGSVVGASLAGPWNDRQVAYFAAALPAHLRVRTITGVDAGGGRFLLRDPRCPSQEQFC